MSGRESRELHDLPDLVVEGKITVKRESQQRPQEKSTRETCPGCGFRKRFSEHPLCPDCNELFISESAEAVLSENDTLLNRVEWAVEKGRETLKKLRKEIALARAEEQKRKKPVWAQAHREVQQNLHEKGLGRIEKKVYHKAVGKKFGELWRSSTENNKLGKRVHGLGKAIESLEAFFKESEK